MKDKSKVFDALVAISWISVLIFLTVTWPSFIEVMMSGETGLNGFIENIIWFNENQTLENILWVYIITFLPLAILLISLTTIAILHFKNKGE